MFFERKIVLENISILEKNHLLENAKIYLSHCFPAIRDERDILLFFRYTVFGGLYSVACTDALQLLCIMLGLVIAMPFSMLNPAVSFENLALRDWLGQIKNEDLGEWVDGMLLLVFGGIPWQVS